MSTARYLTKNYLKRTPRILLAPIPSLQATHILPVAVAARLKFTSRKIVVLLNLSPRSLDSASLSNGVADLLVCSDVLRVVTLLLELREERQQSLTSHYGPVMTYLDLKGVQSVSHYLLSFLKCSELRLEKADDFSETLGGEVFVALREGGHLGR